MGVYAWYLNVRKLLTQLTDTTSYAVMNFVDSAPSRPAFAVLVATVVDEVEGE